jgi:hypothetical protein
MKPLKILARLATLASLARNRVGFNRTGGSA